MKFTKNRIDNSLAVGFCSLVCFLILFSGFSNEVGFQDYEAYSSIYGDFQRSDIPSFNLILEPFSGFLFKIGAIYSESFVDFYIIYLVIFSFALSVSMVSRTQHRSWAIVSTIIFVFVIALTQISLMRQFFALPFGLIFFRLTLKHGIRSKKLSYLLISVGSHVSMLFLALEYFARKASKNLFFYVFLLIVPLVGSVFFVSEFFIKYNHIIAENQFFVGSGLYWSLLKVCVLFSLPLVLMRNALSHQEIRIFLGVGILFFVLIIFLPSFAGRLGILIYAIQFSCLNMLSEKIPVTRFSILLVHVVSSIV
jgi:hypothetical protein